LFLTVLAPEDPAAAPEPLGDPAGFVFFFLAPRAGEFPKRFPDAEALEPP